MDSNKTHIISQGDEQRSKRLSNGVTLQWGKYRIERCLASGGFGNTYEITNTTFGRRYALKEFFIKGVAERLEDTITVSVPIADNQPLFESQKEKFKREAMFLSELNNEHIVHVQDLFEENGTAYYVMDYIDGESLSARMKRTGQPLHESEVMNILNQLLRALGAAHAKNILHLDIKPANIVINNEGHATLIDFGASKQVDLDKGYTLTTTSLAYTPGYAPTEQIEQNKKRIGTWTDIYAVGATLYNLLTNQRPPLCADLVEDDAIQLPPTVSSQTEELIRWMMQPATKKRPQSIREIIDWLHREIGGTQSRNQHGLIINDTVLPIGLHEEVINRRQTNDSNVYVNPQLQDTIVAKKPNYNDEYIKQKQLEIQQQQQLKEEEIRKQKEEEVHIKKDVERKNTLGEAICNLIDNNMVHVDGGTFIMGATPEQENDAFDREKPAHEVTVSSFSIGRYLVTQEEWQTIMGDNPSYFKGPKLPVVNVSWEDCQEFIIKLNQRTGMNFRLPTEAEWEFAARGGNYCKNYKYSGSNNVYDVAWLYGNCECYHIVGEKFPNELGLYDMSGNVCEWCNDVYNKYRNNLSDNSKGVSLNTYHISRGGSWRSYPRDCVISKRYKCYLNKSDNTIGFRLAL